jgi:hypothetical protein
MVGVLRSWPRVRWLAVVVGALATALLVGVPTDLVPTDLFTRMTPVVWWNCPVWAATSVLSGLVFATYVRTPQAATGQGRVVGGGLLSVFAVGCPVCNKLVVLVLGMTGAMTWFAPLQPALAGASVVLLGACLWQRLRGEVACRVRPVATGAMSLD